MQFGEPPPVANANRPVWELVVVDVKRKTWAWWLKDLLVEDMRARDAHGREVYKVPLQAHNGRNVLKDAYEEALDAAVYLRQGCEEGYNVKPLYMMALVLACDLRLMLHKQEAEARRDAGEGSKS